VSNYFKLEEITACKNGLFMDYPSADPNANGDMQRGLAWLYYNGTKTWNASLNLTGKFETNGVKHTLLTGVDYYRLNEFFAGGSSSEFDSVTGDLISNHFPPINIFHPIYN
jgi:outer membrane receptor for monomeric catechols